MRPVYLTYNNHDQTDGAAAQLYRIYGIFCLAKALGFHYLHSPIHRIDFQGLTALKDRVKDDTLVSRFNKLCDLGSDEAWPQSFDYVEISDPEPGFEASLPKTNGIDSKPLVVSITYPHRIMDTNPDLFNLAAQASPFKQKMACSEGQQLRVAVHVRRGDIQILEPSRLIPNSYYIGVIRNLKDGLDSEGIPHVIELHSETSDTDFSIDAGRLGGYHLKSDVVYRKSADKFDEFHVIPDLVYRFNEDAVDSFRRIATASVIVTSVSCFSYVAAFLNPHATTIYHPFFHTPLSTWVVADSNGNFNTRAVLDRVPQSKKFQV